MKIVDKIHPFFKIVIQFSYAKTVQEKRNKIKNKNELSNFK